jgi:hypothetical protein
MLYNLGIFAFMALFVGVPVGSALFFGWLGFGAQLLAALVMARNLNKSMQAHGAGAVIGGALGLALLAIGQFVGLLVAIFA